jgi:hypothetical protein
MHPEKKLIYIADNMYPQFTGGAEINDATLIENLEERGVEVIKYESHTLLPKMVDLYIKSGYIFLISNFLRMFPQSLHRIMEYPGSYSIIEHDHKYLKTRDPSSFPNFEAPADIIVNKELYERANTIFAQSKIHKEIIEKNLRIPNVVNLGMSMWLPKQLQELRGLLTFKQEGKIKHRDTYCVARSRNPTKNQAGTERYCQENNLEYKLFGGEPTEYHPEGDHSWSYFMRCLCRFDTYVHIPAVFETFNRVIVEARMLGLKVISTKHNGCMSEPWFSKYKGLELIDYVESQQSVVAEKVIDYVFENKKHSKPEKLEISEGNITVILNAYRRPQNIKLQVEALKKQSIPPKQIWLWVNAHEDNEGFDFSSLGIDKIFHNNHNWKFYGRFAAALLADTEYIAIYDDDTVPGLNWHENCLRTMTEKEGILGSAGIILKGNKYIQHDRCGWPSQNQHITEVDLVGHAWFFKREWLRYLWQEKPVTWDNGEDIQFAFMAKIHGGIPTYCPPHPPNDKSLWGSILGNELGIDDKATSTNSAISHQQFFSERDTCVQTGLQKGWKTVNKVKI